MVWITWLLQCLKGLGPRPVGLSDWGHFQSKAEKTLG
jgi:hypothetical protein